MLASFFSNFIAGAGLKFITSVVGTLMENRHQFMMANSAASLDKMERMYGGDEKLTDKLSNRVRNLLALIIISTLCCLVGWIIIMDPYLHYRVMIDVIPGIFSGIFGSAVPKETIQVSAGSILWNFIGLAEMVAGYYFTRVSKSR